MDVGPDGLQIGRVFVARIEVDGQNQHGRAGEQGAGHRIEP